MIIVTKPNFLLWQLRAIMSEILLEETQLFSLNMHFVPIFSVCSLTDSVDGFFNGYVLGMFGNFHGHADSDSRELIFI